MTTWSGRKNTSVVTQPRGETADMGDTAESIAAMQELFKSQSLLDETKRREEDEARRREQERLERE